MDYQTSVCSSRQATRENRWQKNNKRNSQQERIRRFVNKVDPAQTDETEVVRYIYERNERIRQRKIEKKKLVAARSQEKRLLRLQKMDSQREEKLNKQPTRNPVQQRRR